MFESILIQTREKEEKEELGWMAFVCLLKMTLQTALDPVRRMSYQGGPFFRFRLDLVHKNLTPSYMDQVVVCDSTWSQLP